MNDIRFTPDELSTLREHGVVLFADRVIFDAQPPMPQQQIDAVQARCAGALPEALARCGRPRRADGSTTTCRST
jgi:hypothetical protein